MSPLRVGGIVAGAILVLLLGLAIGAHMATSSSSAPPPTALVLPTDAPTQTPAPTATTIPVPTGLGTSYYETDNAGDRQIDLRPVGNHVIISVADQVGGYGVYTGTVTGTTLIARAPDPSTPGSDKLTIRVTQPGGADVTLSIPNPGYNDSTQRFPAICGHKNDAYRYLSCHPLTTP